MSAQMEECKQKAEQIQADCETATKEKTELESKLQEATAKAETMEKDKNVLLDYVEESEEYKRGAEAQIKEFSDALASKDKLLDEGSSKLDT